MHNLLYEAAYRQTDRMSENGPDRITSALAEVTIHVEVLKSKCHLLRS